MKRTSAIVLHPQTRAKMERDARRCTDADTRVRYRIILLSDRGWSGRRIAAALGCAASTVSRTLSRWRLYGQAGLIDRREDNGQAKATDLYVTTVAWLLRSTPRDFGHRRPTWTRKLLIEVAAGYTGVRVSPTTMGRVLGKLQARRGRPKP